MFEVLAAEVLESLMATVCHRYFQGVAWQPFRCVEWVFPHRLLGVRWEQTWMKAVGHWAQSEVITPQEWLRKRYHQVLSPAGRAPLTLPRLTACLFEVLSRHGSHPALASFRAYLFPEYRRAPWSLDEVHAMRLAATLADLFWKYLQRRPEMVARWEAHGDFLPPSSSRGELWQPWLWQRLREQRVFRSYWNFASEWDRVEKALNRSPSDALTFWFQLGPIQEVALRLLQSQSDVVVLAAIPEILWPQGQSLEMALEINPTQSLAFKGLLQEPQRLLEQLASQGPEVQKQRLKRAKGRTDLARFQRASRGEGKALKHHQADGTLKLFIADSPMAEVEGVAEELAHRWAKDATLQPRDCLLVVPRLKEMLPYLRARAEHTGLAPFPIQLPPIDWGKMCPPWEAFLDLLELLQRGEQGESWERFLTQPAFLQRWGLSAAEVQGVLQAFALGRARWTPVKRDWALAVGGGVAPAPMEAFLAFLTEQLRQAFALPLHAFHPIPRWGMRREPLSLLAQLCYASITLQALAQRWSFPTHLAGWKQRSLEAARQLLDEPSFLEVAKGLEKVGTPEGLEAELGLEAWRSLLAHRWKPTAHWSPSCLHNAVVCAEPLQARGLSFRQVVVLNLNEGLYPASPEQSSLDLLSRSPQLEDEVPLQQQRASLWEICMGARDGLVLSFRRGEDGRGTQQEPSHVWLEWLRTLSPKWAQSFLDSATPWKLKSIALRTPLREMTEAPVAEQNFEPPALGKEHLALKTLKSFYENPINAWRRHRGLSPPAQKALHPASHLQREVLLGWRRRQHMRRILSRGAERIFQEPKPLQEHLEQEGYLPADGWGERKFSEELRAFQRYHEGLDLALWEGPLHLHRWCSPSGLGVTGVSSVAHTAWGGRVRFQPFNWTLRRLYSLWLEHLHLCASGRGCLTIVVNLEAGWSLKPLPVEEASWALGDLVQLYQVSQAGWPLPLFLESGWAGFQALRKAEKGLSAALESSHSLSEIWIAQARRWSDREPRLETLRVFWEAFEKAWFGAPFTPGERSLFGRVGDHGLHRIAQPTLLWLSFRLFLAFARKVHPLSAMELSLRHLRSADHVAKS